MELLSVSFLINIKVKIRMAKKTRRAQRRRQTRRKTRGGSLYNIWRAITQPISFQTPASSSFNKNPFTNTRTEEQIWEDLTNMEFGYNKQKANTRQKKNKVMNQLKYLPPLPEYSFPGGEEYQKGKERWNKAVQQKYQSTS